MTMAALLVNCELVHAWLQTPPPTRPLAPSSRLLLAPARGSRFGPRVRMTASEEEQPPVDKDTFMAAVDVLDAELAKAGGLEPPKRLSEAEGGYAIGKTTAKLPLSEVGGLGLVEATYLVLVSGVTPPLAENGLQVKDTITSVSVEGTGLHESTRAMDLAATAERLTTAIQTAEKNGIAEIGLEVNRLIELRYAPEK